MKLRKRMARLNARLADWERKKKDFGSSKTANGYNKPGSRSK